MQLNVNKTKKNLNSKISLWPPAKLSELLTFRITFEIGERNIQKLQNNEFKEKAIKFARSLIRHVSTITQPISRAPIDAITLEISDFDFKIIIQNIWQIENYEPLWFFKVCFRFFFCEFE